MAAMFGVANPKARLTRDKVVELRRLVWDERVPQKVAWKMVAPEVAYPTVNDAVSFKTWSKVIETREEMG